MSSQVKFGLIVGVFNFFLTACVGGLVGICGPITGLFAGAAGGFLAVYLAPPALKNEGARMGAIAGGIAGVFGALGQLVSGMANLVVLQMAQTPTIIGSTAPSSSAPIATQLIYYLTGLGVGSCFGFIGILLAIIVGAAVGYIVTPSPAPAQPIPTEFEI